MDSADRLIEQHLVLRCQLGDREACSEIVRRLDASLRYFVRRQMRNEADAAEVVQEVWLTVFRRIGRLNHPEAMRTWLYRIAHATLVNALRRQTARQKAEQAFVDDQQPPATPSTDAMDVRSLHAAIGQLDDKHREVMLLMLVGELNVQEIATVLSIPVGTVKSRAHNARQSLRQWLGGTA